MPKQLLKLVLLSLVFSTLACSLSGASGPTQDPGQPATLTQPTIQLTVQPTLQPTLQPTNPPATALPSAVPPTKAPTTAPMTVAANCSGVPKPQLAIGMVARVTPGSANNLRSQPSKSASLLATMPAGQQVDVLGGPVCADGYQWWQVKADLTPGWTVEGSGSDYWLVPAISVPSRIAMPSGATSQAVGYGNVSFTFASVLSDHVLARTVFGAPHDPNLPMFLNTSQRLEFTLNVFDYTATVRPMLLTVYKISDLEGSDSNYTPMVDAMRTLLSQQTPIPVGSGLTTPITVIPVQNAAQDFRSQARYFKFQNGTGVRFITYYTQGPGPVDNQYLFYVFQGISDDGQYYVSALIPITTRNIGQIPPFTNPTDTASMVAYLTQVAQKFETFGAKDFTPALDDLDTWLASIRVS